MKHLYIKSRTEEAKETLILFHGTGGRETDLLDVATTVNSEANILSLRGDIDENGQTRFFKRLTPKQYDEEGRFNWILQRCKYRSVSALKLRFECKRCNAYAQRIPQ